MGALLAASANPASAQGMADWTIAPPSFPLGAAELTLHGDATGALFGAGPGNSNQISGAFRLKPMLRRDYDSGLALSLEGILTAADPLARGRYDGDALERLAGVARTGLGTLQVGLTDGAGYELAVTGPRVDQAVSLNDSRIHFLRNGIGGRAMADTFALDTPVGASSNYAKFVYASPEIFGVQLALSYTPSEGKQLPFLNAGPHVPGRAAAIWEAALRVAQDIGPVSLSAYLATAQARGEHKLPGQHGLNDTGFGVRADYYLNDTITLSLGGAYRASNAHGFDIHQSYGGTATRATHLSGMVSDGTWSAGLEYGNGVAAAVPGAPRIGLDGLQASLGYQVSRSIHLSTGWQHQRYERASGTFFNGASHVTMDTLFLNVSLKDAE